MSLLDLIPIQYRVIAVVAIVGALAIAGRVYFDHCVDAKVTAAINAYVAQKAKDDAELTAVVIADNAKIKYQLVTTENTITKVVTVNHTVIQTVPDFNTILSNGWISTFNASVQTLPVDPVAAKDATPSGVNADQALDVINTNNGIAAKNLAELTACQNFVTEAQAAVAAQNKKDGAQKK